LKFSQRCSRSCSCRAWGFRLSEGTNSVALAASFRFPLRRRYFVIGELGPSILWLFTHTRCRLLFAIVEHGVHPPTEQTRCCDYQNPPVLRLAGNDSQNPPSQGDEIEREHSRVICAYAITPRQKHGNYHDNDKASRQRRFCHGHFALTRLRLFPPNVADALVITHAPSPFFDSGYAARSSDRSCRHQAQPKPPRSRAASCPRTARPCRGL